MGAELGPFLAEACAGGPIKGPELLWGTDHATLARAADDRNAAEPSAGYRRWSPMGSSNCVCAFVRVGAQLHLAVADCQGGVGCSRVVVGPCIACSLHSGVALAAEILCFAPLSILMKHHSRENQKPSATTAAVQHMQRHTTLVQNGQHTTKEPQEYSARVACNRQIKETTTSPRRKPPLSADTHTHIVWW